MKRIYLVLLILFILVPAGFAADSEASKAEGLNGIRYNHLFEFALAYYPATHRGLGTTGFTPADYERLTYEDVEQRYGVLHGRDDLGNPTEFELKAYYTFQIQIPAMRMDNFLMKENDIKLNFRANVSPLTIEGGAYIELTPLAFLVFELGSKVGTGWDFKALDLNGLAINDPDFGYTKDRRLWKGTEGAVSISKMQATLQFDIGALVPGKWTHVVFLIVENIEYWYFSAARNNQYWRWEHDEGENQNGFVWFQTFFVGYQMPELPLYMETVGVLVETEQRITGKNESTMDSGGWGSDFIRVQFGPLINFQFAEKYNLALLVQFRTERQYTDQTMGNRYFENRQVNTDDPTYVQFYRLALIYNMKF